MQAASALNVLSESQESATDSPDLNPVKEPMSMLRVEDLAKSYGPKTAVAGISFSVGAGEIYGLLGPNGAGKTTTIKMIVGLMEADRGEAALSGHSLNPRSGLLHRIGYLADEPFVYDKLTGRELLRLVAVLQEMDRAGGDEGIENLAGQLLLEGLLDSEVETYSRGNRRKLGLIAALLNAPPLLVLDEPTESLDPVAVDWLGRRLREEAAQGRAVMVSTHHLSWAESICTHVGMLSAGRLLFTGRLSQLKALQGCGELPLERIFLNLLESESRG